ncbi:PREDICTED: CLAVATA3/ESR (CLE)-related protein 19 [Tarenaya hassleriana]|uniref:CLAVATA3/ESR (CLE)-related protein 19 n=1 Tax=Tarenaya hassleriana TaxID=28532 RepID=UPI0008FD1082|nr:PREDICTED: CLAVATA3/ESR (CLE)-related protein 19 [Tarenaya hassleriana]
MRTRGLILASCLLILALVHHSEAASVRNLLVNSRHGLPDKKFKISDDDDEKVYTRKVAVVKTTNPNSTLESKRVIPTGPNPLHNR